MNYEFNAENLHQENYIDITLPNNRVLHIYRGDVGYSIDFFDNNGDIIYEMGWADDDDLELNDEDDEE